MKEDIGLKVLRTPMRENDAQCSTIGEYLIALSQGVWYDGESFSGKRPFGNSGWENDIYDALVIAKLVDGSIDSYDDWDEVCCNDKKAADELINKAYDVLYGFVNENSDSQ